MEMFEIFYFQHGISINDANYDGILKSVEDAEQLKMEIFFLDPPQPQPTIERFGYVVGRQGIVNVTVYANPRPHFKWRVNNEMITEGNPDESNRLETSTAVDLVN